MSEYEYKVWLQKSFIDVSSSNAVLESGRMRAIFEFSASFFTSELRQGETTNTMNKITGNEPIHSYDAKFWSRGRIIRGNITNNTTS